MLKLKCPRHFTWRAGITECNLAFRKFHGAGEKEIEPIIWSLQASELKDTHKQTTLKPFFFHNFTKKIHLFCCLGWWSKISYLTTTWLLNTFQPSKIKHERLRLTHPCVCVNPQNYYSAIKIRYHNMIKEDEMQDTKGEQEMKEL